MSKLWKTLRSESSWRVQAK